MRPPTTSPRENPLAPNVVKMDSALLRSRPSAKLVVMMEKPVGAVKVARQALHEPCGDEDRGIIHEPTQEGSGREDRQGDEEDPAAAQEVREPAAQKQQAAVAEDVRGDNPLQGVRAKVQFMPDGRQGHAHHGHIQSVQGQDGADNHQQEPLGTGPADGRGKGSGRSFEGGR
jgi:hypothetical protein